VVGFPVNCPAKPTPWVAEAYKHASYIGPGAPPRVRLPGWKPTYVEIGAYVRGEFPLLIEGRVLAHRHRALSMGLGPRVPKHCGWPKKTITWSVRPAKRLKVATGTWTGTATFPNATGTVTVKVTASGRMVDFFELEVTCPEGGGGSVTAGSLGRELRGQRPAHRDTESPDECGQTGRISGTFTAQRTGP
jgi:hypothetical protein